MLNKQYKVALGEDISWKDCALVPSTVLAEPCAQVPRALLSFASHRTTCTLYYFAESGPHICTYLPIGLTA